MPSTEQESGPRAVEGSRPGAMLASMGRARNSPDTRTLNRALVAAVAATIAGAAVAAVIVSGLDTDHQHVATVFLALAALVVALELRRWPVAVGALIVAWYLAVIAAKHVPDLINPGPPVGSAVGGAAYFDTPYEGAQIGAALSVAVPLLVGLVLAARSFILHRREAYVPPAADAGVVPSHVGGRAPRPWIVWVGAAVLGFTLVPDLRGALNAAHNPIAYQWDVSNITTWQLFVQMGLVPMKDFFFPYGFQWLYDLRTVGPLFQWLEQLAVLAIATWALWRLTGGRPWRVIACLVLLVLVGIGTSEAWRYIPALLVPVTYAAVGPARRRRPAREHGVFFLACLLAMLIGADVLGVGLGGVVLVFLGEVVAERVPTRPKPLLGAVVLDAVPILAAVLLVVLIWLAMGVAPGNLRFLGDVRAVSSASALNEQQFGPAGLLGYSPHTYSIYAAIPALLTAAGLAWSRMGRTLNPAIGPILLSGAGFAFMMLLKQFVRPVFDEELIAPLIALGWTVILTWQPRWIVRSALAGAAVAGIVALLAGAGNDLSISSYLRRAVESPGHAVRSALVAFDPGARRRADRERFDPSRFTGWPDEQMAGEFVSSVPVPPVPPFAIVGDAQLAYVLLRQTPPYQVELYDASPIAEQQAMLRILERRRPPYVIWSRKFLVDDVPYVVRDPLIFSWMVDNYVPIRTFPDSVILRRRRSDEAIPAGFWRGALGGTEDLGYIPSFSTVEETQPCSGGTGCVPYVEFHGPARAAGSALAFVVTGNHRAYGVLMRARAGVSTYPVRLDRLWFWDLVGPHVTVAPLTPGYRARVVGRRSGGNLY